jgi:uncharacterized protein
MNLPKADIEILTNFLAASERPDGTMCFQELQGFLFAVACSPEIIPPSDWLPIVSNEKDFAFHDEAEAQSILELIIGINNSINATVAERSKEMPRHCVFQPEIDDNFDEHAAISQWCRGFIMGHDWLTEVWDDYLPDEMDGDFGSTAIVLSFFASRRLADMYHLDSTTSPRKRKPRVPFYEFAETIRGLFPDALSAYAHIGRSISEVLIDSREPEA